MTEQQEQLRRDIERTRAELAATVDALSHKADVKAQLAERAQVLQTRAREQPAVPVGIGVAVAALWVIRRRRRSR